MKPVSSGRSVSVGERGWGRNFGVLGWEEGSGENLLKSLTGVYGLMTGNKRPSGHE